MEKRSGGGGEGTPRRSRSASRPSPRSPARWASRSRSLSSMKRRGVGRDFGLSCSMVVALALLLATYLGIVTLCAFLIAYRRSYWWLWVLAGLGLAFSLGNRYRGGGAAVLCAIGAETMPIERDHGVHSIVERLAGLADISSPRVAVAATAGPNALAVGLRQRGSAIVLTQGLLDLLDERQLEAVIAHEIAHLAHRDAAVMTAVSAPRVLGEVVVGEAGSHVGLLWLLGGAPRLVPPRVRTTPAPPHSRY